MTFIKEAAYNLLNYRLCLDIARPSSNESPELPPLVIPGVAKDSDTDNVTDEMRTPRTFKAASYGG
jgi:hypothetical protein